MTTMGPLKKEDEMRVMLGASAGQFGSGFVKCSMALLIPS